MLTWHGVGPQADVVHEAKQHEAQEAQDVGLVEELHESKSHPDQSGSNSLLSTTGNDPDSRTCRHVQHQPGARTLASFGEGPKSVLTTHLAFQISDWSAASALA